MTDEEITPLQRARMAAAAEAIAAGRYVIPLRCGHCNSTSLYDEHDELHVYARMMRKRPGELGPDPVPVHKKGEILTCNACGRKTSLKTARRVRKQEIKAYIRRGIDVPLKSYREDVNGLRIP